MNINASFIGYYKILKLDTDITTLKLYNEKGF